MSQETKSPSKEELTKSLYDQAEQQLITAVEAADKLVIDTQQKLQQAQNDRIAVHAQIALIRKVNDKVQAYFLAKDASSATT